LSLIVAEHGATRMVAQLSRQRRYPFESSSTSALGSRARAAGGGPGRHPEVRQDALHRLAVGDDRQHAERAVALRALERVDSHRPSEERRPIDARGHGVQQAAKQPVPVVDGDDMGGEDRDRREHGAALALRRDAFTFPWRTPAPRRHVRSFGSVSSRLPRPRVRLGRSARMGLLRCR